MARANADDLAILQMALVGYESEKHKIEDKIDELKARINGKRIPAGRKVKKAPGARRILSAAARARIAAAQKRRWREHRKRAAQAAKAR